MIPKLKDTDIDRAVLYRCSGPNRYIKALALFPQTSKHILIFNMHDPCWEPGTQYNYDDVVQYEGRLVCLHLYILLITNGRSSGHRYKIIQPHRSQVRSALYPAYRSFPHASAG